MIAGGFLESSARTTPVDSVYLDLHIHTSENPDRLNQAYDLRALRQKIEAAAEGCPCLISLTDHNTINKAAYIQAVDLFDNLLLGAELHIRNYDNAPPYHCHIFFRLARIDEPSIDAINRTLDDLYPRKVVSEADRIPKIEEIAKRFDEFEFVLLPHAGQSHSTFDSSIPAGVHFDSTIERSIYYNYFDGFTARSNAGLERTHEYFERLGIREFINLITSTDNYCPNKYPQAKAKDAAPFVPTWMLASPTFNGLRLSLSESDRLVYGERPDSWAEYIRHVSLANEMIDVDVTLTPGLNVVIGGSSSGKTLFVDSVYRRIAGGFEESDYRNTHYGVEEIEVQNPSGQTPHYLPQNYIVKVCDQKDRENTVDRISLLKSVFPGDADERKTIENGLIELGESLQAMVDAAAQIEQLEDALKRIPLLSALIVTKLIKRNPLKYLKPTERDVETFKYPSAMHTRHVKNLTDIDEFLKRNPLVQHDASLVEKLKAELAIALSASQTESRVREIIEEHAAHIDEQQKADDRETNTKKKSFGSLLTSIRRYMKSDRVFYQSRDKISKFSIKSTTREIEAMGHCLFIDNEFELTKEKFLEVLNQMLRKERRVDSFDAITPHALSSDGFRKRDPKINDNDDLQREVMARFQTMNRKKYRIITKDGKDFDQLSAGWKTSVILDLVLGCSNDTAALIIDQPEDNLATTYINSGLLQAIKKCKASRQIILVSHNATIPMLGDAQNVIVCRNDDKFITIRSSPLEGVIDGRDVVDVIASTTDGGKISIKKRVKKYNLKRFRGDDETGL